MHSHFYATGGYVFDVNRSLKLKPSTIIRQTAGAPLTFDASLNARLYDKFEVQKQRKWVRLLPHRTVTGMHKQLSGFDLAVDNNLTGLAESYTGTVIILATGFETKLPQCLAPIMDKLELSDDGLLQLDQNFKVRWQGNAENSIYAVNAGLGSHGIADPQLSLAAWRSAKIINDLAQETCFDISESSNVMEWGAESKVTPFSAAELVSVA